MLLNHRLPGNGLRSRGFGGSLVLASPARWNDRNAVANRVRWDNEYSSFPVGWRSGALVRPMKDGGIAAGLIGSSDLAAAINGQGEMAASATGAASVSVAAYGLTALKQAAAALTGSATVAAGINGRGQMEAEINVSQLTDSDVNGAVLDALIEDGMTVKQALRLLLAVAVGKTTITDLGGGSAEVVFRDVNDTKDRVTASMTGSERSSVDVDQT